MNKKHPIFQKNIPIIKNAISDQDKKTKKKKNIFEKDLAIFLFMCYNIWRCISKCNFIYGEVLKWSKRRDSKSRRALTRRVGSNPTFSASGKLPLPNIGGVRRYAKPHTARAEFKFISTLLAKKGLVVRNLILFTLFL